MKTHIFLALSVGYGIGHYFTALVSVWNIMELWLRLLYILMFAFLLTVAVQLLRVKNHSKIPTMNSTAPTATKASPAKCPVPESKARQSM